MDILQKKVFKCLIFVTVFLFFFSIPLIIFNGLKKNLINMEIKGGLEKLSMWAELYKDRYGTYKGMEKEIEIEKIVKTLNYLDAECQLVISGHGSRFCSRAMIFDKKIKNWCVDSTKYSGSIIDNCDYGKEIKCE